MRGMSNKKTSEEGKVDPWPRGLWLLSCFEWQNLQSSSQNSWLWCEGNGCEIRPCKFWSVETIPVQRSCLVKFKDALSIYFTAEKHQHNADGSTRREHSGSSRPDVPTTLGSSRQGASPASCRSLGPLVYVWQAGALLPLQRLLFRSQTKPNLFHARLGGGVRLGSCIVAGTERVKFRWDHIPQAMQTAQEGKGDYYFLATGAGQQLLFHNVLKE